MRGSVRSGRVYYRNVEQTCSFRIIVVDSRLSVSVGGLARLGKWARSTVSGRERPLRCVTLGREGCEHGLTPVETLQSESGERIDHYPCVRVPQRHFTVRGVPRVEIYVVDRLRLRYLGKARRTASVQTKCSKKLVNSDIIQRCKNYGDNEDRWATAAPCQYELAFAGTFGITAKPRQQTICRDIDYQPCWQCK